MQQTIQFNESDFTLTTTINDTKANPTNAEYIKELKQNNINN